ncbi:MAG TPA: PmoA family protein [Candidatus Brocadiia bacterium]|nr:PmoA family protein [Candidatus Brocadiia bacterium]
MIRRIVCLPAAAVLLASVAAGTLKGEEMEATIKIEDKGSALRIEADGQLLAEYRYKDVPRPFFYPLIGPTGKNMTRHWPMSEEGKGESRDHVHHKGLWFTHGSVNGVDFWAESDKSGKIVHDKFLRMESGGKEGVFECANQWVAATGKVVCTDRRVHRISKRGKQIFVDYDVTIEASQEEITLGDTKEGSMAIRMPETMRVSGSLLAKGFIVNSEGIKDAATWGKRATWVDYYGPLEGETVGVAMFDHPSNPRHPTTWHVRDYGLFAANPFGIHDFEKKPAGAGDMKIAKGESATFRWRVYLHPGDAKAGKVAEEYARYAGQTGK